MYGMMGDLKKSNSLYEKNYIAYSHDVKVHQTLFLDFTQSEKVEMIQGVNDRVTMETKSSHFNIINPYVSYVVKDKILYRIESYKTIPLTITHEMLVDLKYEMIKNDVARFKVFFSKKHNSYLITLDEMVFEISK